MDREIKLQYIEATNQLEGKDFITAIVAFNAAPTIKGIKPASLINFTVGRNNRLQLWQHYKNEICKELGLEYIELREKQESTLVLYFKRNILKKYLFLRKSESFLQRLGYKKAMTLDQKLYFLKERFINNSCPNEVGLFLGYPIKDIEGFIKYKGKKSLICRYWKVYDHPRRAEKIFGLYDKAKASIAQVIISYGCNDLLGNLCRYLTLSPRK